MSLCRMEEVYKGQLYGTLKSELKRLWHANKIIVFDIDVVGATDLKRLFPKKSLAIFIKPPSIDVLAKRLTARDTESPEKISMRVQRATLEMKYEDKFDAIVLNDDLEQAKINAINIVRKFIEGR